eukprot:SM000023S07599  [mRNA]  locus=s23:292998:294868:- [translate_table: standard]
MARVDSWLAEFGEAMRLTDDVASKLQERGAAVRGGEDPSRLVAAARRKLAMLATRADRLEALLADGGDRVGLSEKEVYRRQDMLLGIRYRAKQMAAVLNTQQPSNRKDLLERDGEKPNVVLETDQTAELENSGIIHLQKRIMKDQDEELVGLESTVASTKHIALAVNEELDLHSQLLDDLDRDVESTNARVAVAQRKLAVISKRSSRSCTFATMCLLLLAIVCLVLVVLWLSKYL